MVKRLEAQSKKHNKMTLETKLKLAPWMETQCSRQAPTESKQSVAKAKYTINQHGLVQQIITKCVVCGKHSASFRVYKGEYDHSFPQEA